MKYVTTVLLFLADEPDRPIPNVRITLHDRDRLSADDLLGSEITDEQGEATVSYTTEDFMDLDDRFGGAFPDLYAVVLDREGNTVTNLRAEAVPNLPRKQIAIPLDRELALRHGLIEA
jgi:hypothetical protein